MTEQEQKLETLFSHKSGRQCEITNYQSMRGMHTVLSIPCQSKNDTLSHVYGKVRLSVILQHLPDILSFVFSNGTDLNLEIEEAVYQKLLATLKRKQEL